MAKLLSDKKCANAKPKPKAYRLNDGDRLALRVLPDGARYWQFRYRYGGKEITLQIGPYPTVTLEQQGPNVLSMLRCSLPATIL